MSFISADRNQKNMLGYCVDDFISQNDKCRFAVQIVSKLDLSSLYNRYSSQGNDAIDPKIMLSIWFLAYSEGIVSTRRLEERCRHDVRYMYVSAMLRPDHTTLSRFRKQHLDLMSEYFVQIVLLAQKTGHFDFQEINIDGTKIKASCSGKQSYKEDKLTQKIEALRNDITAYMERCDQAEADAEASTDLESLRAKIAQLKQREQKLIQRRDQLQKRKQELKAEHRNNHQINIVEPDAPMMANGVGPGYNAQGACESEHNFIVANDVTTDGNDLNQFSPMHQQAEANLGKDTDRKYNADSGYFSLTQLDYASEHSINAVIADPVPQNRSKNKAPTQMNTLLEEGRKLERSDFAYNAEEDYYLCPAGQKLKPSHKKSTSQSKRTIYKARNCYNCPLNELCITSKSKTGNRQIHRDHREQLAEQMQVKLETDEAKSRLKTRASTIEPAFGNIKHNLGFSRFSLRGLNQVKGEFNLMCIAHNMNILYRLLMQGFISFSVFAFYLRYYYRIMLSKSMVLIAKWFLSGHTELDAQLAHQNGSCQQF